MVGSQSPHFFKEIFASNPRSVETDINRGSGNDVMHCM